MDKSIHRRILLVSMISIGLIIVSSISIPIFLKYAFGNILPFSLMLMIFPSAAILVSFLIVGKVKPWIFKAAKYSTYFYPVIVVPLLGLGFLINMTVPAVIIVIAIILTTLLAVIHIFIFSDPGALKSTAIFIVLMLVAIMLKRFQVPFSGTVLTITIGLFGLGSYMYGIRCLFLSDKNRFLKYVSFLGSCLITIFIMGILWKFQHWPGGNSIVSSSHISLVIGTLIVLLTLPSSGYLDWTLLHKQILKRLILPWIFIFTLFIIRYLLPSVDDILWRKDVRKVTGGFGMTDYKIELKNNLEQE
jgi:hypothetical protein